MAEISLPSEIGNKAETASLQLVRNDHAIELMNGAEVMVVNQIAKWQLTFSLPPLKDEDARLWASRLSQLTSFENTFKAIPPGYEGPSTNYSGSDPTVDGANQTGKSINCTGVSTSTDILNEGDYLAVNGELKKLTSDASSDSSGNVTFQFEPKLRSAPSNGATVEIQSPKVELRLESPEGQWSISAPLLYTIQFTAVETFGP